MQGNLISISTVLSEGPDIILLIWLPCMKMSHNLSLTEHSNFQHPVSCPRKYENEMEIEKWPV